MPPDLFRGLSNLQVIDLDDNNLSSVPPDLFRGLSNLQQIDLDDTNLSSVPPDLFRGLSNLQQIDLDNNNLSSVPPDLFRGLSNLQQIELDNNNLSSVPPDLFRGLSNLQQIELDNNNLSSVPPDLFRGLSRLAIVYIKPGNDELTCLPQLPERAHYYHYDYDGGTSRILQGDEALPPCDKVEITPDPLTPLIEGGNEENEREYTVEVNFTQKEIEDNKEVSLYVSSSDSEAVKVEHSHDGGTTWHSHKNPNEPVGFSPSTPSLPFRAVAVADEDNNDEEVTISHRLNGKDYPLEVEVHDLKLILSESSIIFTRTATRETSTFYSVKQETKTYTVKLNHSPQSNNAVLNVKFRDKNRDAGTIIAFRSDNFTVDGDNAYLTFNKNNWDQPENIIVLVGPGSWNVQETSFPFSESAVMEHSLEIKENEKTVYEKNLNVVNTIDSRHELDREIREELADELIEDITGISGDEFGDILAGKVGKKGIGKIAAKVIKHVTSLPVSVALKFYDILKKQGYIVASNPYQELNPNKIDAILSDYIAQNYYQLQQGTFDWRQAFSNRTFFQPFYLGNQAQQPQVPGVPEAPSPNLFLRAGFDYSSFDESDDVTDIDGDNMTYIFGLDFLLNPSIITGASLVIANSESDISDSESGIQATYDLDITSLHPYISWNASDRFSLFASLGYGKAHSKFNIDSFRDGTELADILLFYDPNLDVSNVPDGLDLSPLYTSTKDQGDFFSLSTGLDFSLWQADNSSLALSLQGSTTTLLAQKSSQASLGTSLARTFPLDALTLESSLDLTWLMSDSGPGALELSGSFDVFPDTSNLSLLSSARVLLTGDRNEWGVSSTLRYQKNNTDEGLSLALYPSFGDSSSRLDINDFRAGNTSLVAANPSPPEPRLSAELAYGFRTGDRLLTPYTDLSFSTSYSDYTAGLRYQLDSGLDLDLNATHRNRPSGNNDNLFFLQLRSDL